MSDYIPCRAGNEWPVTTLKDAGVCKGCGQRSQCPAWQSRTTAPTAKSSSPRRR